MKCYLGVILIFQVAVDLCTSALIGSTIKSLITITDTGKQKVCKSGVKTLCHKEVRSNITPSLSRMCVDGIIKLVRIPEGYTARTEGLDRCTYAGKTFCDGDNITPNYKGWSTKHYCLKGNIRYSVSGRRLKTNKSTISKPSSSSSSDENDTKDKPSFQKPSSQKPSFQKPSSQKPSFQKPSFQKPSFQKPSFQKPNSQKPSFQKPSFQKKPTTKKPNKKNPFTPKPQKMDKETSMDADDMKDEEDSAQKKPAFSTCK